MANLAQHRGWSSWKRLGATNGILALVVVLGQGVVATPSAKAQADVTLTVLHSFGSFYTDGFTPYAGLIRDAAGNLYGTTYYGGDDYGCGFDGEGCGTVFRLDTTGREAVLYMFNRESDGLYPVAGLVRDAAGNLYGTTSEGGASNWGTVFKLDTAGSLTVLHSFTGVSDGDGTFPLAGLVRDAAGNLYGTTYAGGASNFGTVFKLDATGTETVLYSFTGMDGEGPVARLVRDAAGNLYGTTQLGGAFDRGTVFKLDTTGAETVLHSFHGWDGRYPYGGLVRDAAGNLYGTTYGGGVGSRQGTVFKVDGTGRETVLHSFTGGTDGANPEAGLVRDPAGNLYGTTYAGGASNWGTVFKLDTTGAETVLYSFTDTDGAFPRDGLIRDAAGNLYGTTGAGGAFGVGTVFKLSFLN